MCMCVCCLVFIVCLLSALLWLAFLKPQYETDQTLCNLLGRVDLNSSIIGVHST
jgi:hypothetical protein